MAAYHRCMWTVSLIGAFAACTPEQESTDPPPSTDPPDVSHLEFIEGLSVGNAVELCKSAVALGCRRGFTDCVDEMSAARLFETEEACATSLSQRCEVRDFSSVGVDEELARTCLVQHSALSCSEIDVEMPQSCMQAVELPLPSREGCGLFGEAGDSYTIGIIDEESEQYLGQGAKVYCVELGAGRRISITTRASNVDPIEDTLLALWDPDGEVVGFDDDNGPGRYSSLELVPEKAGAYTILVQGFEPGAEGRFELAVRQTPSSETCVDVQAGTYEGRIEEGDYEYNDNLTDVYCVDLAAGETATFTTSAPSSGEPIGDTSMGLWELDGRQLAWNKDAPDDSSSYSTIEYTAETAGTYLLHVDGWLGWRRGAYTLTVEIE